MAGIQYGFMKHVNKKEKNDRYSRDKAVCSHRPRGELDVNVNRGNSKYYYSLNYILKELGEKVNTMG